MASEDELEDWLRISLGGRAAEQVVFGRVTNGAASDLDHATAVARTMVFDWGMGATTRSLQMRADDYALSEETKQLRDREQREITGARVTAGRSDGGSEHRPQLDRIGAGTAGARDAHPSRRRRALAAIWSRSRTPRARSAWRSTRREVRCETPPQLRARAPDQDHGLAIRRPTAPDGWRGVRATLRPSSRPARPSASVVDAASPLVVGDLGHLLVDLPAEIGDLGCGPGQLA